MPTFDELTTPTPHGEHYTWDVPEGWLQGRATFGGIVIAALVRAIEAKVGDPARTLRSLTVELPGPVAPGPSEIAVDVLRAGNNVTTARATLTQAGGVKSHAVAVLGATRKIANLPAWQEHVAPVVPAWTEVAPLPVMPMMPQFAANSEMRFIEGMPGTSGEVARCVGWIRLREPGVRRDAAYIAALADAWFPATFVRIGPRAIATIAYTLEIIGGFAGLDPDAPLLYRGTVPVLNDGYFLETRELWGSDGRLVALNHQTMVVIA